MSTYLVTGGAGFIGSHVVHTLVDRGENVRVYDDLSTGRLINLEAVSDHIEMITADVRDFERVRAATEGAEYVVHLAACSSVAKSIADPLDTSEVNIGGTLNVLVAAREAGARRVIVADSAAVYGDQPSVPNVETQVPRPLSPYAVTKLAGGQYCRVFTRVYGLGAVALRFFNVFGPRQNPDSAYSGVLSKFLAAYQRGETPVVFGDGEQSRDFIYVSDAVDAILSATTAPEAPGRAINIGTGISVTLNQAIGTLNRIFGREVRPDRRPPRPGDIRHSLADIRLAREILGYEPQVDFEEGLRRTAEWCRVALDAVEAR